MAEKTPPHRESTATSATSLQEAAPAVVVEKVSPKRPPDSVLASYGGPLPLPSHFEHFERVLPGAAERILGMAEAEQRSRLTIEQHESLVATDLAKREAALQEASINGRLSIERQGNWLGFATNVIVIGAALAFAYIAPDRIDKIGSLIVAACFGAAQVVVAFKRGTPPKSREVPPPPPPPQNPKRRRSR